jgi:integrase/recombinase XerD
MKAAIQAQGKGVALRDLDVGEGLIREFLANADLKPISQRSYKKKLREFFKWCLKTNVQRPDRQTILDYKRHLISKKFTPYSISGYLVPVRCLFRWMSTIDPNFHNIAAGVKGVRRPKTHCRDAYSVEQVNRILSSIDRSTLVGKRDYALIRLLATTGLRSVEVTRVSVGDIRRVGDETVLYVCSKGSDAFDDMVALVDHTLQSILEYLTARGATKSADPLFASLGDSNRGARLSTRTVRRITHGRARDCSISSPTLSSCHSYRHFFVSSAVNAGVGIDAVREAARHRSIISTQIYIHRANRSKGLVEKAVDDTLQKAADQKVDVSG